MSVCFLSVWIVLSCHRNQNGSTKTCLNNLHNTPPLTLKISGANTYFLLFSVFPKDVLKIVHFKVTYPSTAIYVKLYPVLTDPSPVSRQLTEEY